ncbi:MAG: hypothetical protein RL090_1395 [Bacteroidota bacterium]|jgi:hypothetical protein
MNDHQKNTNEETLKSKVPSEEIFLVPDGYFEKAQSAIHTSIKSSKNEHPVWPRYLVAASISATLIIASYLIMDKLNAPAESELSHEELAYCIQMEGLTQDMVALHLTDDELESINTEEDQDAIQDYLMENQVDINHLTLD